MGIIASSNTLKRNCRLSKESNFRCPDHRAEEVLPVLLEDVPLDVRRDKVERRRI
ncbi:hypothetical protein L798_09223 [Zootermopsis nevadensis]|uniref:Uncharacterized protein n=1 Tax=Zootermopsis nevadensis TaxID=136037 RepID=A0A067RDL4_ZOONE|nr:hypothetical protein L798_09223 [Zootermopsis nevadensis]